ncbi:MAG: glycine--tRNA ligase subunit beta [Proteobacteria bacterium]|nr:glycine--tRNA ligase subunit beta [Pseudomonadota bacterium]
MGKELLLEIGTEEIPARFTPKALKDLASLMEKELEAVEVSFGEARALGTPRRLALWVDNVAEFQKDAIERKVGPPKHVAFDEKGNPTKPAQGFAKAQGVRVEDLETVSTEKGEYLCAVRRYRGGETADVLRKSIPKVITSLSFMKSMRWGSSALRFVRPIHWILALFGGHVVPFKIENVESGAVTYGHRFMSPGSFKVEGFQDYLKKLRQASVIVDPEKRRRLIEEGIHGVAREVSGKVLENRELLEEVTYLVEYPVIILGDFEKDFLTLPKEVIVHAMEDHQRYFPVVTAKGKLLPHFVCVCNTEAVDMNVVRRGNERVLRARLSDARFFFDEDTKTPLHEKVENLKDVIFQTKLGTSYEKVMRLRALSRFLAKKVKPELEGSVGRAAFLCKADLVTGMVGEFPSLQGVIGREYALLSGETRDVADAIYEHYLPAFAGDRLPSSPIADLISVADKLDTIVGCFGVGLIPTGAGDPFALRRQALGILNILLDKRYPVALGQMVSESLKGLREKLELSPQEVGRSVLGFFKQRFQNLLISKDISYDIVEAVVEAGFDNVVDCHDRIVALAAMKKRKEFAPLAVAFKRVVNISRESPRRKAVQSLFKDDAEQGLHQTFLEVKGRLDKRLGGRDYEKALVELTRLKEPVDRFFDSVLVMDKNAKIRDNRLALLGQIADLFSRIADFSRIVTE